MQAIGWLFSLVLALANLLALAWLVLGLRSADPQRLRVISRRSAWTFATVFVVTLAVTALLAAVILVQMRGAAPEARASAFARGISEALNTAAAGALLGIFPAIVWIVIAMRSRGRSARR